MKSFTSARHGFKVKLAEVCLCVMRKCSLTSWFPSSFWGLALNWGTSLGWDLSPHPEWPGGMMMCIYVIITLGFKIMWEGNFFITCLKFFNSFLHFSSFPIMEMSRFNNLWNTLPVAQIFPCGNINHACDGVCLCSGILNRTCWQKCPGTTFLLIPAFSSLAKLIGYSFSV